MKIGELARQSGLPIDTIRFYERQGLVPPPARTSSNYRQYQPEVCRRLRFIRKARELGFTLEEIGELLELSEASWEDAGAVLERAQAKLHQLEERIREMQGMKKSLERLVQACSGHGPRAECPILEALLEP